MASARTEGGIEVTPTPTIVAAAPPSFFVDVDKSLLYDSVMMIKPRGDIRVKSHCRMPAACRASADLHSAAFPIHPEAWQIHLQAAFTK